MVITLLILTYVYPLLFPHQLFIIQKFSLYIEEKNFLYIYICINFVGFNLPNPIGTISHPYTRKERGALAPRSIRLAQRSPLL